MTAPAERYVFTSESAALNAGIIRGNDRVVLVDTGSGPRQAAAILAALRAVNPSGLPVTVINTHDHWDHWFGNSTVAESGITDFLASDGFVRDAPASAWVQYHEVPIEHEPSLPGSPNDLIVDVRAVGKQMRLDLGGRAIDLVPLAGHTDTDLVVIDGPVAFVGDLVEEGAPPQAGADATPSQWLHSLDIILALPGLRAVVPGHGSVVDLDFVRRQREDIAEAIEADLDFATIPVRRIGTGAKARAAEHVERIR